MGIYGKMPMKNGKPDPVWMVIFLIFSTALMGFVFWIFARNGFIVAIGSLIWILLVLKAKYD